MVNADRQFKADVLIRDGLILKVAPGLKVRPPGNRWVPARCCNVAVALA